MINLLLITKDNVNILIYMILDLCVDRFVYLLASMKVLLLIPSLSLSLSLSLYIYIYIYIYICVVNYGSMDTIYDHFKLIYTLELQF